MSQSAFLKSSALNEGGVKSRKSNDEKQNNEYDDSVDDASQQ